MEAEKVPMKETDARAIFFYLALRDNGLGEHINIDAIHLAESCFPGQVRIIGGKKYLSHADGFRIRSIIKKTIVVFKQMAIRSKMDGGRFVPIALDERKVQYNPTEQTYRIKVLRPKDTSKPVYDKEQTADWEIIPF